MNLIREILKNKIFIYPTDTIYGIGCNALDRQAVEKIREIKQRDNKPFSIIAPSIEWIENNLVVDCDLKKYLPGPYTVILKKKNPEFLSWVSDKETLGVRIPDNDFCRETQKSNLPFITTSVNLSGKPFATSIEEIDKSILDKIDIIVNSGKLSGKPSTLVINGELVQRS